MARAGWGHSQDDSYLDSAALDSVSLLSAVLVHRYRLQHYTALPGTGH